MCVQRLQLGQQACKLGRINDLHSIARRSAAIAHLPLPFFILLTPFAEAGILLAHGWGSVYNLPVAGIWLTGPCDVGTSHRLYSFYWRDL